jgi:hypothetical protein
MALRARSMALSLAALLNVTHTTFGHAAPAYAWRQRWVTESGLGVCVPSPPVSSHRQLIVIARRH